MNANSFFIDISKRKLKDKKRSFHQKILIKNLINQFPVSETDSDDHISYTQSNHTPSDQSIRLSKRKNKKNPKRMINVDTEITLSKKHKESKRNSKKQPKQSKQPKQLKSSKSSTQSSIIKNQVTDDQCNTTNLRPTKPNNEHRNNVSTARPSSAPDDDTPLYLVQQRLLYSMPKTFSTVDQSQFRRVVLRGIHHRQNSLYIKF